MEGVELRSWIHPLRMEGQALRIPSLRIAWSEGLVHRIGFKLTPSSGGVNPPPFVPSDVLVRCGGPCLPG